MGKIKIISSGLSIPGLLGVVFVTLKLIGVINWSWWWVTLPFWAGLGILAGVYAFVGLLYLILIIVSLIRR